MDSAAPFVSNRDGSATRAKMAHHLVLGWGVAILTVAAAMPGTSRAQNPAVSAIDAAAPGAGLPGVTVAPPLILVVTVLSVLALTIAISTFSAWSLRRSLG